MTEEVPRKADFYEIYNQPDPRAYFATLAPLGYEVPQHGADVFGDLLAVKPHTAAAPPTVLDLCCSYGVGGILLTTDLRLVDLYDRYAEPAVRDLSAIEIAESDRAMLAQHRRPEAPRVLGLDVAEQAVSYAISVGALDVGFAEDLETSDPSEPLAKELGQVDLITTAGGIGYVTEKSLRRITAAARTDAWVAALCLREYDYGPISDALGDQGMTTERAGKTFVQRRFIEPSEQEWAVSRVSARGLDPTGKEADGCLHADLYVSRPDEQVAARPLADLLPALA